MSVDKSAHALEGAYVKCVLGSTVSGTLAVEFPVRLFVLFGFLQSCHLSFSQNQPFLQTLGLQGTQPLFHPLQIVP